MFSPLLKTLTPVIPVLCDEYSCGEGDRDGARGGDSSTDVGVHLHQPGEGHARAIGGRGHQALGVGKR